MTSPRFLNIDLDLRVPRGMRALVKAMGKSVFVLFVNDTEAHLEVACWPGASACSSSTPEAKIRAFVELVRALPARARSTWDLCSERTFNAGFEVGSAQACTEVQVSPTAIADAASVHAGIAFTLYVEDMVGPLIPLDRPTRK